jgi:hypothetical protein
VKPHSLAPLVLAGCFGYASPPHEHRAPKLRDIAQAKILELKVQLYKQPGLCPGKEAKLYADATVQWPRRRPVARTIGNEPDSLHPSAFSVQGALVKGDINAHLFPDPDVLKSVENGFDATIIYTPEPRFTFKLSFPPEYSCFNGFFDGGAGGGGGTGGDSGEIGDVGIDGRDGDPGGDGGHGGNGGRVTAYVTLVKTHYYDRLLAVFANDRFFLAPADRKIVFGASGGAGGGGGAGGHGGRGGNQHTQSQDNVDSNGSKTTVIVGIGRAGNGGGGGNGGNGGDGGNGGEVDVTYDGDLPELLDLIEVDVSGGTAGSGGSGGGAGSGGLSPAVQNPQKGADGQPGHGGFEGHPGQEGRAIVRAGKVRDRFRALPGLTLLGDPVMPPAQPVDVTPKPAQPVDVTPKPAQPVDVTPKPAQP